MGILSTRGSRSVKAAAGDAINASMKKSHWTRMAGIAFFLLLAAAFGSWSVIGRTATVLAPTAARPQNGDLTPTPSRSNLKTQLARFDQAYLHIFQASATGKYSRYRAQLRSFLAQAKTLQGYAQANYQKKMENSQDAQKSSLELAMVVDVVTRVSRVLDGPQNARSARKLAQQTRMWLPRLEVGLEQDKAVLDSSRKPSGRASPRKTGLSDPYTVYSEATGRLRRAQNQLSAGDLLGAWLSVAQADMLVGNLAMRLPPSTSM